MASRTRVDGRLEAPDVLPHLEQELALCEPRHAGLLTAHPAAAGLTARAYQGSQQAGGPGSRCGSDQRAVGFLTDAGDTRPAGCLLAMMRVLSSDLGPAVVRMDRLPGPLERAIADVATTYGLKDDWLNLGPASLLDHDLPPGFEARLEGRDYGPGLTVWLAGEHDLIFFKLYAAADQDADDVLDR